MVLYKTVISTLLMHWRYCNLALSHSHGFVLSVLWLCYQFLVDSFGLFTQILKGCFTGTGAIYMSVKQPWRIWVKSTILESEKHKKGKPCALRVHFNGLHVLQKRCNSLSNTHRSYIFLALTHRFDVNQWWPSSMMSYGIIRLHWVMCKKIFN